MSLTESLIEAELISPDRQHNVIHCIDPLQDRRWDELVERHPQASVFHSSAWLSALARTYQYRPVAYVASNEDQRFECGMVFCQVESWLTGRRLVSLPFSDHCEPLVNRQSELDAIAVTLEEEERSGQWRYIETRPLWRGQIRTSLHQAMLPFTFHQLDLEPDLATLYRNCHKNSTQRKIVRAEREGLQYGEGTSAELLDEFYKLLTITRQRHHRPPQPREWFVNLIENFGDALKIRVARKDGRAVAAIVTIRYKDTMYYKYGGSDRGFNHLGSMHFLLWGAIQEAKSDGLRFFDFGRTDADQHGLITFKKRWGTAQSDLIYSRYSRDTDQSFESSATSWKYKAARFLLARMQPGVLSLAGRALYRHVG